MLKNLMKTLKRPIHTKVYLMGLPVQLNKSTRM